MSTVLNYWERCDALLCEVQKLLDEMIANNDDNYGLLNSARVHVISARGDIDADQK